MTGYERVVLACRPVRYEDYPPDRRRIHAKVVAELGLDLPIYPGSTYRYCHDCGIQVVVGPRQQAEIGPRTIICCMIDAVIRANQQRHDIKSLDNPFRKHDPNGNL